MTRKFFAILGSLILDILTLPIRLLTCIPRAIVNASQEDIPLKRFLTKEGADNKLFESGHVRFKLEWVDVSKQDAAMHTIENKYIETNINFVEMPAYPGDDFYHCNVKLKVRGLLILFSPEQKSFFSTFHVLENPCIVVIFQT